MSGLTNGKRHRTSAAVEIERRTDELGNPTRTLRIAESTSVEEQPFVLHPAEELQRLKEVSPDLLPLYIAEVTKQGDHRRAMEESQKKHEQEMDREEREYRRETTRGMLALARFGQRAALAIAFFGIACSVALGYFGHVWLAGTLATTCVLTIVGAFLNQPGQQGGSKSKGKLPSAEDPQSANSGQKQAIAKLDSSPGKKSVQRRSAKR